MKILKGNDEQINSLTNEILMKDELLRSKDQKVTEAFEIKKALELDFNKKQEELGKKQHELDIWQQDFILEQKQESRKELEKIERQLRDERDKELEFLMGKMYEEENELKVALKDERLKLKNDKDKN